MNGHIDQKAEIRNRKKDLKNSFPLHKREVTAVAANRQLF